MAATRWHLWTGIALFTLILAFGCREKGPIEIYVSDGASDSAKVAARACDEGDVPACARLADLFLDKQVGTSPLQTSDLQAILSLCSNGTQSACNVFSSIATKVLSTEDGSNSLNVKPLLMEGCKIGTATACDVLLPSGNQTDNRKATATLIESCKFGITVACDRLLPKEKGLFARIGSTNVSLNMLTDKNFFWWGGSMGGLEGYIPGFDKGIRSADYNKIVRGIPEGSVLILVTDPVEPAIVQLDAVKAELVERPRRDGDTDEKFRGRIYDAFSYRYIGKPAHCLSAEKITDTSTILRFNCPVGSYFIWRDHDDVESWFYPIILGDGGVNETHCGNRNFVPAGLNGAPWLDAVTWSGYSCQSKENAGYRWGRCLGRASYTHIVGAGCPGSMLCCPGN